MSVTYPSRRDAVQRATTLSATGPGPPAPRPVGGVRRAPALWADGSRRSRRAALSPPARRPHQHTGRRRGRSGRAARDPPPTCTGAARPARSEVGWVRPGRTRHGAACATRTGHRSGRISPPRARTVISLTSTATPRGRRVRPAGFRPSIPIFGRYGGGPGIPPRLRRGAYIFAKVVRASRYARGRSGPTAVPPDADATPSRARTREFPVPSGARPPSRAPDHRLRT